MICRSSGSGTLNGHGPRLVVIGETKARLETL